MEKRYLRNFPALSEAECGILSRKRVLIVGCGGLGGTILELLLRIGVGYIRVCDGDVFDETNLNRQLLSDVPSLGKHKTAAARERARKVNPSVVLEAFPTTMDAHNVQSLLNGCDAVVDALDNIASRRILADAAEKSGIPYVFGAIGGWVAQVGISLPGEKLIEKLYPPETVIKQKSVLSFTPAFCASLEANLCIQLLVGRPVKTGTLYYFDLLTMEWEVIPL